MKKIQLLYILFLFVALNSCKDEEYVAPNSFSDVSWYSVVHDRFDAYPILGQRKYYSISDISQGAKEHKWELLDSAIYFLGGEIVRNDSTLEEKIIGGGELGDISEDKTVHLYFPEGGIQSVRLFNTFEKEVSFRGEDTTFTSVYDEEKELHVFDHTFTVDVYHDIKATYKVYDLNGDTIDFAAADTINIDLKAGDQLSFVQTVDSMYHMTDLTWTFPKSSPNKSTEDSVAVTFYTPGVIDGFTLKANRSGQNIPSSAQTVTIPLKINVGQSDKDFTIVSLTKQGANELLVQLSGQAVGALKQSDFNVTAENTDLGQNFSIQIEEVLMIDNNTRVSLKLVDPIYSNDKVIVEYSGSTIKSSDDRTIIPGTAILEPITDLSVVDQEFYTFNTGTDGWSDTTSDLAGGQWDFPTDPAGSGGNTMSLSVNNTCTLFLDSPSNFELQEGTTYKITYKLYLDTNFGLNNGFSVRVIPEGGAFNDPNRLQGGWMAFGNTNHFNPGVWVTHSYEKVCKASGNYFVNFRIGKGNQADYGTFFVDDINIEVVDTRPAL